ncbi:fungal-specific transcription factor domain-containing protein [Pseudomassariella vexata]|uniref:Fungal-specific transcription factor domain-domain-containing protein n=1 Tax=Pseudomassariella vexata TaxID=1141098 RepID=A0A1Y2DVC3_9PEZI|nr:fungal-specific transcription factor domain-containing protein [Pseudomassariella vexata]ORY63149.1 fungal-specific transcription factor domain-domain-containing protein [Pseudomassariella vexata]
MDGSHYQSNVIGTSASSYPSPAAISPHQLQQNGHMPPHTLPPLQPQNPAMQSIYGSHPHTPRTPGTPGTPNPPNSMSNYPPPSQGAGRGYPQMMQNPYPQPHQGYGTSSSMMPQSSVAASHPQPIAPAPASRPPVLRPMPAGGVMPQSGLSSPYGQSPLMPHQQSLMQESDQPTHVVGSQGRRGILPSAPGRPAAPTGSGAAKSTVIPQKDADGKFPCPHCTKTYLHAKHLKRHLLRHTGDRPYMCVLCRDTFSRSDILKRHFQKCSIRRGNPTGASHLSHPQAHVKKHQQQQQKQAEGEMAQMNGMNNMQGDNVVHPFGMVQMNDGMQNMANDQNQLSRSSSMSRMEDANNRDRRSMTGGNSVYNGDMQSTMASNINPQLANYSMSQNQNGMPMFGGSNPGQQDLNWNMFQQTGAQETYVNTFPPPNPNLGQTQIATKREHNLDTARATGLPGTTANNVNERPPFFANWGISYHQLSSQIINFFHTPGAVVGPPTAGINTFFSPANIKDFLEKYIHYHVHFSFLHTPTFHPMETYTGLLAGMCCIGACYSDQVSPDHVRDAMNFLKIALDADSDLLSDHQEIKSEHGAPTRDNRKDIEQLQALVLLTALLLWNGTPAQRETSTRLFPMVAGIARRRGLLQVSADSSLYSILHQPNLSLESVNPQSFDWSTWVEQERRVRLMHMLYLTDVAQSLYFNTRPQFDSFELHIPLPADDAAWEAQTPIECAEALHLYGSEAAKARNPDGSQRSKQPEVDLALKALFHPSYQIHPGSTNLYGKFIIVHCLLAQIRHAQLGGNLNSISGINGSLTPLSQNDWIFKSGSEAGSGNVSANNSGRATPVNALNQGLTPQVYKSFCTALDKFKSNWDMDMAIQFPPNSVQNPRRYGFSRDGIHHFWLAKWLLKNTRPGDLQMPAEHRFRHVMGLLKSVKAWVMSDGVNRGEEMGSVGDIANDYGARDAQDLTVNMTDLFRPLPQVVNSPAIKTEI